MLDAASVIIEKALKLMEEVTLCDKCLGRFFANLGFALSNEVRGSSLKTIICMISSDLMNRGRQQEAIRMLMILAKTGFKPARELLARNGLEVPETLPCGLCEGLLYEPLHQLTNKAVDYLLRYDFNTYLIGCKVPGTIIEREDTLRSRVEIEWGESIKREINREASLIIMLKTGKKPDFQKPDVLIILDFHKMDVEIKPSPVFIYGRYRKLVRGIPQSKWLCPSCRGSGCPECDGTGRRYKFSVEELITKPIIERFEARSAKFHGAGREDIDVRVLGSGRPFVVEVIEPKKRFIDLEELQREVNERSQGMVEVLNLSYTDRSTIGKLKLSAKAKSKTYRALIEMEDRLEKDRIKALSDFFRGVTVKQWTPKRVLHRRADKLRIKRVYEVEVLDIKDKTFEVLIKCQGGLYVKELVHGDEGRTTPSFQEFLGTKLKVLELDVLDVED
ncbi:MAG: tRNA pseudouridine(54/55) synthase Pus10 [Candidatus Nezhaarchaeales archaeon]